MHAPLTVDGIFRLAAREQGSLPYLIHPEGGETTYAEIHARACRVAGLLAAAGVGRGDRVVSLLGNGRPLYEFYIATSMLGAIAVPINVQNTCHEIDRLLKDCTPRACIAEAELLERLQPDPFRSLPARWAVGAVPEGWQDYEAAVAAAAPLSEPASAPEDPVLIIYSSGTTGTPKGITLRHSGVIGNSVRVMERLEHRPTDRFVTLLPSFHLFGYNFEFLKAALMRAPIVVMRSFEAQRALELIERFRVTVLHAVPTIVARMFDEHLLRGRDIGSLRLVYVGGGPVSPELKRRLREEIGVQVSEGFGQTECSAGATIQPLTADAPYSSCGPALRDFEIRIVDERDEDVPLGESGEILVRCPTPMVGYWNQPELTAHTLRGGWLHTGDIGKMDADGNVYVLDRLKDMLVSNGFNVFPKEVENAILSHPATQLAGVVGVPDEIRGDTVHAFVTLKGPAERDRAAMDALAAEILQHARERLSHYKWPRSLTLVKELPLTATGKVRRFKLREMQALAGGAATEDPVGELTLGRAGDAL